MAAAAGQRRTFETFDALGFLIVERVSFFPLLGALTPGVRGKRCHAERRAEVEQEREREEGGAWEEYVPSPLFFLPIEAATQAI